MKKKVLMLVVFLGVALVLTGCWPAEVGVTTTFNADGSGERTIVIDIMDDTLSDDPIGNPDDPDGDEGKGAVVNDKHITGGLPAIQTWLEENAPDFITVEDSYTDGYHRYFVMSYSWTDFDDFITKYQTLVNLSPTLSWDDFDEEELPTLETSGLYTKEMTFTESRVLVVASLDWAVDGIWNDIYDEADLAGFVTKADISVLAGYKVVINESEFEEAAYYDPDAADGDEYTGVRVFVESESFETTGEFSSTGMVIGTVVVGVLVVAGAVFAVMKFKK
jgi:hypothetical protein